MTEAAPLFGAPPPGAHSVWLRAEDGVRLRAALWRAGDAPSPRGAVLLLHGRTEFIEKTYDPVAAFLARGFDAATVDWRGQGLSDRPFANRRRGYVDDFAAFRRDAAALMDWAAAELGPGPRILFGHSMGGPVAARMLRDPAHRFVAGILSAPMLGLTLPRPAALASRIIAAAAPLLGLQSRYAFGYGDRATVECGFPDNCLTSDPEALAAVEAVVRAAPDLGVGGVTWGWLRAAWREMDAVAAKDAPPLRAPTLVVLGDGDSVVSRAAIDRFAAREPLARLAIIPGARHEPFLENPSLRARLWDEIDSFLAAHGVQ